MNGVKRKKTKRQKINDKRPLRKKLPKELNSTLPAVAREKKEKKRNVKPRTDGSTLTHLRRL